MIFNIKSNQIINIPVNTIQSSLEILEIIKHFRILDIKIRKNTKEAHNLAGLQQLAFSIITREPNLERYISSLVAQCYEMHYNLHNGAK